MDCAGVSIHNIILSPWTTRDKLYIASLNSHFPHLRLTTKYGEYSEVAMFHEISGLNKKNP
jgi:hypothetical protein